MTAADISAAERARRDLRRGREAAAAVASDPSRLGESEVGAWPESGWRRRALRRALMPAAPRRLLTLLAGRSPRRRRLLAEVCFWAGVREAAGRDAWRRFTSGYVVLVYHRFAGELRPGQERIDISARRFRRQLRLLRLLGFRPLSAREQLEFHSPRGGALGGRRLVVTADDAMADAVEPLRRARRWLPQLFVPTAEVGGAAHWIDGEPVADWAEIRDLSRDGVAIGSHARHHRRLSALAEPQRVEELEGSLADLRRELAEPLPFVAFPNGDHDAALCRQAERSGYAAAYTTEKGRNGAGTNTFALRRVSVHGHDGLAAIVWKATTGEALPAFWRRLRDRRYPPPA